MFNILFKGCLAAMTVKVLENYRQLSIQYLKIEAAKSYVQGVQMARQSTLGLLQLGFVIGLISVGVILFHAALFFLLPWSLKAKAILGLLLGALYMVAGIGALVVAMDEKRWLQKSGATAMIKEATGQNPNG